MGKKKNRGKVQGEIRTVGDPNWLLTARRRQLISGERLTEMQRQHPWVAAGTRVVRQTLAAAPLKFRMGEEEEAPEAGKDHPCRVVFDSPNPLMTGAVLRQAIAAWLWETGYIGLVKESGEDARLKPGGIPRELWPVNGALLSPLFHEQTQIPYAWRLDVKGRGQVLYRPDEILWIRNYNPYDPWRGLGYLEAIQVSANQDYAAALFAEAFFENGAQPGGILQYDRPLKREDKQTIRETWEDMHKGSDRAHRISVLEKGVTFTPGQVSQRDMEFQALRRWNRDEILAVIGVPKILVGVVEDYNRATASTAKATFLENTMIPVGRFVAEAITRDLHETWIGCENVRAEFDWSVFPELSEVAVEKVAAAAQLFAMAVPFEQINERLRLGFKPIPTGSVGWISPSLIPAGLALAPPEPETPALPAAPGQGGTANNGNPPPMNLPAPSILPAASANGFAEKRKEIERRALLPRWELFVAQVIAPVEAQYAAKVRRWAYDLRRELLAKVADALPRSAEAAVAKKAGDRKFKLSRPLVNRLLFDEKAWADRLLEKVSPLYDKAAKKSLERTKVETAGGGVVIMDEGDPRVARFLAEKKIEVQRITARVQSNLRETLVSMELEGSTVAEVHSAVIDVMKGTTGNVTARAATIARTEMAEAANGVRHEALKDASEQEGSRIHKHRWLTARDAHVRLSHERLEGDTVKIGEPFANGLEYPGDIGGPPAETVSCRCIAVPVVDKV